MSMKERIGDIRERIEKASLRSGRKPEDIRLMAVSKFHSAAGIEEAYGEGVRLFGESRVREALEKFPGLKKSFPDLEVHMIGSLQRNKVKNALEVFDGIHSLDRDELLAALGMRTAGREKPLPVLLEFHTGEASKSGYDSTASLLRAAEEVLSHSGLALSGLMTMAPWTRDEKIIRSSFRSLVRARDILQSRFPRADLGCLSMGMSNDFEIAIEEGSTLLRIGTAIFGGVSAGEGN